MPGNPPVRTLPSRSTITPSPYPLCATLPPNGSSVPPAYRSSGSVLGSPSLSRTHPGGSVLPAVRASFTLPSATTLVVMSTRIGSPPVGMAMAIGLVESRRSVPPHGAMKADPSAPQKIWAISPCSASISAYAPARPMWKALRTPIAAMPVRSAFAAAIWVANSATAWPQALCPSINAVAAASRSTVGRALGSTWPRSTKSVYCGSRNTPCESWPTRLAKTRWRATISACSG